MALSTSKAGDGGGKDGNFFPVSMYVIPMTHQHMQTLPILFLLHLMARSGWASFNVAPAYYDAYEAGDTRRNVYSDFICC